MPAHDIVDNRNEKPADHINQRLASAASPGTGFPPFGGRMPVPLRRGGGTGGLVLIAARPPPPV